MLPQKFCEVRVLITTIILLCFTQTCLYVTFKSSNIHSNISTGTRFIERYAVWCDVLGVTYLPSVIITTREPDNR